MPTRLTRRRFLHLAAAAIAGTVAAALGAGRRVEPTEMVTHVGNGSPLWLDFEGIGTETVAQAIAREEDREMLVVHKWRETNLAPDVEDDEIMVTGDGRIVTNATRTSWAASGEPGIISPAIRERYHQLVESGWDREQAYMQAVLEEWELQEEEEG